ncbi:MAG: hypothetical protein IT302_02255 [Dehalococcoidia bacterium]|nr:hypothetical protein [Dehalococcoidia bacterium]
MDDNEQCEMGECRRRDRWHCASLANWDALRGSPWGDDSDAARLRYLASMTGEEANWLAQIAETNLRTGGWQGVKTDEGGFEDGPPWDENQVQWRATARDFLTRREHDPDAPLTEGMILYALHDLSKELAWYRGWCPLG